MSIEQAQEEPNFSLVSEYFQLKEQYENRIKQTLRNKKKTIPKCIFCNNDGGNTFKMTSDKYIIECKEKKCSQKQTYNRILKTTIEEKLISIRNTIKNLIADITKSFILDKYNLENKKDKKDNNQNIQIISQTLETYIQQYDELQKTQDSVNNIHLEEIQKLKDTKNNLIEDLKNYNNEEFLNFNSIAKINNEIQNIDNDILNYNYEVKYVDDYFNRNVYLDSDVNSDKYNCSKPESKQLILRNKCIESLEINFIE